MRRIILIACLLAPLPALAEDPPTIILRTPIVSTVMQYLSQRPYAEVAQIMAAIQQCVLVQIPNDKGAIVSHGECPEVTAAMQKQATPEKAP